MKTRLLTLVLTLAGIVAGQTQDTYPRSGGVGTTIASASTIAPIAPITLVSGTTTINTITAPASFAASGFGGCIYLVATGAWSTGTSGNISNAITAAIGNQYTFCYNSASGSWATPPSGTGGGATSATHVIQLYGGNAGGGFQSLAASLCNTNGTAATAAGATTYVNFSNTSVGGFCVDIPFTTGPSNVVIYGGALNVSATGNSRLQVSTICFGSGSNIASTTYNAAQVSNTIVDASSTYSISTYSIASGASLTATGCTSGNIMRMFFQRDNSVGSNDTAVIAMTHVQYVQ